MLAAGVGGIPVTVLIDAGFLLAIGRYQDEAVLVGNLAETHVGVLASTAGGVAVQQHD